MRNLQNLRARMQKSGRVYYYFDAGGKPRKEIPLGSDYVLAVRQWSQLMQKNDDGLVIADFEQLAVKYEIEVIPLKAKSTQSTNRGDMKKLREFFCKDSPAPLDEITPRHIQQLLEKNKKHPTTANRLKRLFSHMFNKARAWGYTEKVNPVAGVKGYELDKREVYVSDDIYKMVWAQASEPVRDVMDLAYLTGQRPGDVIKLIEQQIQDGYLILKKQNKTGRPLRIRIEGEFQALLERIASKKEKHKVWCSSLAVGANGGPMTRITLRRGFLKARAEAIRQNPDHATEIAQFWFYDIRAKAADDTADVRGDQAASDQLGHVSVNTTKRHYLRRGKKVGPTK